MQTRETFIERVVRLDNVASTNITALERNFDNRVPDVDTVVMFYNVRQAIVRNALRRYRLAAPQAAAVRRQGFNQGRRGLHQGRFLPGRITGTGSKLAA